MLLTPLPARSVRAYLDLSNCGNLRAPREAYQRRGGRRQVEAEAYDTNESRSYAFRTFVEPVVLRLLRRLVDGLARAPKKVVPSCDMRGVGTWSL